MTIEEERKGQKKEESGIGEDMLEESRIEIKRRRQVRRIRRREDRTEEERR